MSSKKDIYYLVLDTETTGLNPKNVDPSLYKLWNSCRMVQIAWELYEKKYNVENDSYTSPVLIDKECFIIKPYNYTIPDTASAIHGITTEIANKEGIDIDDFWKIFESVLFKTDIIIAYNIDFDNGVILSEMHRSFKTNLIEKYKECKKHCVMKLNTRPNEKWPKLFEMYEKIKYKYFIHLFMYKIIAKILLNLV